LIVTKIGDGDPKRVHWNQVVWNIVFEEKNEIVGVKGLPQNRVIGW
jgi:hypothetical protein